MKWSLRCVFTQTITRLTRITLTVVSGGDGTTVHHWYDSLQPYYHLKWSDPAFHCPAYRGLVSVTTMNQNEWGSYSYNIEGAGELTPNPAGPSFGVGEVFGGGDVATPPRAESHVIVPSATFAFMDSAIEGSYGDLKGIPAALSPGSYWMGTSGAGQDWTGCFADEMYDGNNPYATNGRLQHGYLMNVASCDAHVDVVRAKDLFNPKVSARNWNYDHQTHADLWP
jgi:hypothetical protein